MLYVLQNFHWFIILIGALVFFHELGHFLVAKLCRVKVLRFSLGFGPRLVGFTRGETEYRISALPLGGYVKMLGEIPGTDIPLADAPFAFTNKPLAQRAAVVIGGPAFNFLLALVVYFFMFAGNHSVNDARVGMVSHGGPAWEAGLRPGDRILAVDGVSVRWWAELREAIGNRPGETFPLTYERDGVSSTVELTPKIETETDIFGESVTRGRIGISPHYLKPVIAVVDPESPAARAGLQTDDHIESVGTVPTETWHEVRNQVAMTTPGDPVKLTIRRGEETLAYTLDPVEPLEGLDPELFSAAEATGRYTGLVNKESVVVEMEKDTPATQAGLRAGDRLLHVALVKPDGTTLQRPIGVWTLDLGTFHGVDARSAFTLTVQRGREILTRNYQLETREEKDELKNVRQRHVFGAKNDMEVAANAYQTQRYFELFEALGAAAKQVIDDTTLLSKGIGMIVRGRLPIETMGGPIMLFVIAEKSAKRGLGHFLGILAVISVNLGLLNLLPVPVLDGGHLMFFAIEAVRRRPPSIRVREIANLVGLAILLTLMVLVFRNDIMRYILG